MKKQHTAQQLLQHWRLQMPGTRQQLAAYIKAFLGWRIPDHQVCAHHQTPMDYLAWSLGVENGDKTLSSRVERSGIERSINGQGNRTVEISPLASLGRNDSRGTINGDSNMPGVNIDEPRTSVSSFGVGTKPLPHGRGSLNQDVIIWANRGGGKTQLGAVASLLECVFLPRCSVRILGGSQEQSERMYEYLRGGIELRFADCLAGRMTGKGCRFANGSDVQVLAQADSRCSSR